MISEKTSLTSYTANEWLALHSSAIPEFSLLQSGFSLMVIIIYGKCSSVLRRGQELCRERTFSSKFWAKHREAMLICKVRALCLSDPREPKNIALEKCEIEEHLLPPRQIAGLSLLSLYVSSTVVKVPTTCLVLYSALKVPRKSHMNPCPLHSQQGHEAREQSSP